MQPSKPAWRRLRLVFLHVVIQLVMAMLFCAIVPIGLLMRVIGKDPLRLRFDKGARSYWIPRTPPGLAGEHMKSQF